MGYSIDKIRNICLLGHGSSGKTTLAESILYRTGVIDRQGKVADGNTVSDYDAEEVKRQISISATTMYTEYDGHKINIIDTPGYFDFEGEVVEALRVADAGVIVVSAKDGVSVGAEKAWKKLSEAGKPAMFFVSKIDEEHGDFTKAVDALKEKFGHTICPMVVPMLDESGKVTGIIDIIINKAFEMQGGKRVEVAVPAHMQDTISLMQDALNESVAETTEELMEKYFSGEPFTQDEIIAGIKQGVKDGTVVPVVGGSAMYGLGSLKLLDIIINFMPSPAEGVEEIAADGETVIAADPNGATCAIIYKTLSDQYGKFSFFKVLSGKVSADMQLTNPRTGTVEKMGHIYNMQGKKSVEVKEIGCGDIGAVSKLVDAKTGDSLCAKGAVQAAGLNFPAPCYSMAIAPKVKGQDDKVAAGLARMREEDYTFSVVNNAETRQMVISGLGDIQIDVICAKLKSKFGVEVELSPARVAYREKIRKKVSVRGRHKKQSGGHGQFGDVVIEFEPCDSDDLVFEEKVFGGSVPKNFFPAVEKGLRDCIQEGVLAGYPVVNLKATLVDGSYHPVDSSEMAFKMAASLAYKEGLPQANPVILEPVGSLKVTIPDSNMGDIIGDLNKRRGRVMGMTPTSDGQQIVEAEVPMGEMSTYAIDLRSMTQGRGSFTLEFVRYEETPAADQQKIIDEAKKMRAAE